MMKMSRKRALLLLALLAALVLSVAQAAPQTGSLSLTIRDTQSGGAAQDGTVTLRRVADVSSSGSQFVFTAEFAGCGASLSDVSSAQLLSAAVDYAKAQSIPGDTKSVSGGQVSFDGLPQGLYLVTQDKAATGFTALSPFLVTIPMRVNGELVYDVDASPKAEAVSPVPTPTPSPTPTPTPPPGGRLPQTGQLWWPVPALACAGLLLLTLGQLRKRR